jgi:L-ascorbate metabolism protein UlaG (beta-lactamase superfamily)
VAAGSLFFVGTATTLLRYAGFTVLTDPNFLHMGDHVHLGGGVLRSRRLTDPAMEIEELPKLDLVLLSHMHEDHFDRIAARYLDRTVTILTTPHAAKRLRKLGFEDAVALETWEERTFTRDDCSMRVTSMPGRHAPGPLHKLLPSVMGSMLDFRSGERRFRIYVSGDTLVHDDLREIPRRFPGVDLALLHLGGTRVFGLMLTMDGKQGVEAMRIVAPETTIPIHYDDYDVFKSPLADFKQEVERAGLAHKVHYLVRGESYTLPDLASLPVLPAADGPTSTTAHGVPSGRWS